MLVQVFTERTGHYDDFGHALRSLFLLESAIQMYLEIQRSVRIDNNRTEPWNGFIVNLRVSYR